MSLEVDMETNSFLGEHVIEKNVTNFLFAALHYNNKIDDLFEDLTSLCANELLNFQGKRGSRTHDRIQLGTYQPHRRKHW